METKANFQVLNGGKSSQQQTSAYVPGEEAKVEVRASSVRDNTPSTPVFTTIRNSFSKVSSFPNFSNIVVRTGTSLERPDYNYNNDQEAVLGGDRRMDEAYKKMIDRLDQDIRDHKQEVRDRDARLQTDIQERELRSRQELKEREERLFGVLQEIKETVRRSEDRMESNIKDQLQEIKDVVKSSEGRIDQNTKHVQALVTTNKWGMITTLLAILAIAVGIAIAIYTTLDKPPAPPTPPAIPSAPAVPVPPPIPPTNR